MGVTLLNEFGNVEVLSGILRLDRGTQLDGRFLATPGTLSSSTPARLLTRP